jgi:small subunit ribosomal protein S6
LLRKYEGMFLFDPVVVSDWEAVQAELNRIFERAGARVIASAKWDERRLAYEIRGRKRGVYVLAYFEVETSKLADIERDVQLSESALRCMILRVDHMTEDEMKEAASHPASHAAPEDDRGDRPWETRRHREPEAPPAPERSEPAKVEE